LNGKILNEQSPMTYRRAVLAVSLAVVVIAMSSFASRSALGLVVEACRINSSLTGSPYPCLKVVRGQDALSSYAVLREPTDKERTILAPLADVSGIEDPRLLAAGAPNYFSDAWKERRDAMVLRPQKDDFALAINAAVWRTQDRLHIHMGCETPRFRALLKNSRMDIGSAGFTKLKGNAGWWARFYAVDDLSVLNPLQVVADGVDGARAHMKDVVVGVFSAAAPDGRHGFYVLARVMGASRFHGSAEDMIDPKCML
jgi:CDP-diacylglycerol pyrophosphatase